MRNKKRKNNILLWVNELLCIQATELCITVEMNDLELQTSTPMDNIPNKQAGKSRMSTILYHLWRLQNYARLSNI